MVVSVKYSLSFPKVEILKFDPMNIPNWSCRWTKGIGVRDFRFFYQHYYSQISICTAYLISSWVCLSFRNRQSTGPLIRMTYITSGPCSVLISSCNTLWVITIFFFFFLFCLLNFTNVQTFWMLLLFHFYIWKAGHLYLWGKFIN